MCFSQAVLEVDDGCSIAIRSRLAEVHYTLVSTSYTLNWL